MNKRLQINNLEFNPGLIGLVVNPFYIARMGLLVSMRKHAKKIDGKVLDVGCGKKPYEKLFNAKEYIGLEYDSKEGRKNKKADFYYNGKNFPFKNKEFDNVICNQVLEHVFNPDEFLYEISRVLKKGGHLLLTVPFLWDEHEQPVDYARYSSFGLKHLLEKKGFKVLKLEKNNPGVGTIFQLLNAYVFKKTRFKTKIFRIIAMLCVMFPINIMGVICGKIFPKNDDLYLDNVVLAQKVK